MRSKPLIYKGFRQYSIILDNVIKHIGYVTGGQEAVSSSLATRTIKKALKSLIYKGLKAFLLQKMPLCNMPKHT